MNEPHNITMQPPSRAAVNQARQGLSARLAAERRVVRRTGYVMARLTVVGLGALFSLATVTRGSAEGRKLRAWTHQELVDSSDVVLVGVPYQTRETSDRQGMDPDAGMGHTGVAVVQRETLFRISVVLRGKVDAETLAVHYLNYHVPPKIEISSPRFMRFEVPSRFAYLLYLRRRPGGGYVPTGGDWDAGHFASHSIGRL